MQKSLYCTLECANLHMEKMLNKLADLILEEMESKNYSLVYFADICNISRNEMNAIVNHKKKDILLSTVVKICENSEIVITIERKPINEPDMSGFVLTNGKEEYRLLKIK